MSTYFTTRSFDDVDVRQVRPGDRIIHLNQSYPQDSGRSNGRDLDVAGEAEWTGERLHRGTRYSASSPPSIRTEDGASIVLATDQIGLTWPGAETGALQVFFHPDWPGSFNSVNLSQRFWANDLLSLEDIKLRADLLPDDPRQIPGVPRAGLESDCLCCHARIDLRHSFGHAWRERELVCRVGTSEVIARVEGSGMIREDGPYCGNCIDAAFQVDLKLPEGRKYRQELNRSLPPGEDIPDQAKPFLQPADRLESGMWRYGRASFEWSLETDPSACRERLNRARATFAAWKARWSGSIRRPRR